MTNGSGSTEAHLAPIRHARMDVRFASYEAAMSAALADSDGGGRNAAMITKKEPNATPNTIQAQMQAIQSRCRTTS